MTTHQPDPAAARQAELDAARLLLDRMVISPADLLATPGDKPPTPTFAEYIPQVRDAVGVGTRRVYGSYWNRILDRWGERRLDEISASDIRQFVEHTRPTPSPGATPAAAAAPPNT